MFVYLGSLRNNLDIDFFIDCQVHATSWHALRNPFQIIKKSYWKDGWNHVHGITALS